MNIYLQKPITGKTTKLIQESAKSGYYIVCMSTKEVSEVHMMALKMRLNIPFPLTFDEFIAGNFYGKGIKGFLIDDADLLLNRMGRGVPIVSVSMTEQVDV